jgi:hypothetical protein
MVLNVIEHHVNMCWITPTDSRHGRSHLGSELLFGLRTAAYQKVDSDDGHHFP